MMKKFKADVIVLPKDGVLDIQGKAVEKTLHGSGFDAASDVRVGKFVRFVVEAESISSARGLVRAISEDLLVNDLIESCTCTLKELP
jgi:phosphoribosylformylglycinamidine synthase